MTSHSAHLAPSQVPHGVEEQASVAGGGATAAESSESGAGRAGAKSGAAPRAPAASSSAGGGGGGGGGGASYRNMAEAEAVMQVLTMLAEAGDVKSVALLTPYRGQVRVTRYKACRAGHRRIPTCMKGRCEVRGAADAVPPEAPHPHAYAFSFTFT